jgi:hypothetical protein
MKQFTRMANSGNEVTGVFCPECGVRIYHVLKSAPDVASIKPGTPDDTRWLQPERFIWMKSAQGWLPLPDGVKTLERQDQGNVTMPKGYFFVEVEIDDPAAYEAYCKASQEIGSIDSRASRQAAHETESCET